MRLVWLPMVLSLVASVAVAVSRGATYWSDPIDAESAAYYVIVADPLVLALMVLQLPLVALSAVAVHRLALFNDNRPGEMAPFSFGRTEGLYIVMGLVFGSLFLVVDAVVLATLHLVFTGGVPGASAVIGFPEAIDGVPAIALSVAWWLSYGLVVVVWAVLSAWPASVVARQAVPWNEAVTLARPFMMPLVGLVIIALLLSCGVYLIERVVVAGLSSALLPEVAFGVAMSLLANVTFWISTVFFVALASFTYKWLRGYRPDEVLPQ